MFWLMMTCGVSFLLFSCTNNTDYVNDEINNDQAVMSDTVDCDKVMEVKSLFVDTTLESIIRTLDLPLIQKEYGRGSTSASLSKQQTCHLYYPDTNGYYGMYFFVNNDINLKQAFVATVVIFAKNKPWLYSNKDQSIIEFTSYSSVVDVLRDFHVGDNVSILTNEFGEPKFKKDNVLFYQDQKNVVLSVMINGDVIEAYKIGYYNGLDIKELADDIVESFL